MNIFENFKNLGKIKIDSYEYEHPLEEESSLSSDETEEKTDFINPIFYILFCLVLSTVLIGQLLKLQITKGIQLQLLAEGNRIRSEEIKAPRGIIYDNKNNPLVKNVPNYQLVIYPMDLPKDKSERVNIYELIKESVDVDLTEMIKEIEERKLYTKDPIIVKENLNRDEALLLEIKFNDIAAVKSIAQSIRQYQEISSLSHVLGYMGLVTKEELEKSPEYSLTDSLGKTGLELAYQNDLQGQKGVKQIEVNAQGILQRELATQKPVPGNNLITTIDSDLQEKAYEILEAKIKELNVEHGVVIIQNPQTGGILTMTSYPSYDNNLFAKGIKSEDYQSLMNDPAIPMLNRAISGTYPSGSVIKPVIAVAGLDKGVITEDTTIDDPGEITIGEWVFPDWKNHGLVDVRKAIAVSCNVFFYAVGGGWDKIKGLGVELVDQYLDKFGFGKKTEIEILGEVEGLIPDPDWKERQKNEPWYLGDTYHLAIGQGDLLVTPLQMINAISAIANGGKLLRPHFALKETDQNGNMIKEYKTEILNDKLVDNQYSLQVVREGMRQAVEDGSARQLQDLPVPAAGKTGTAQFAGGGEETHAWFTAFAPYENPEISIIVLIERGGGGEASAEPVAKDILKYYFENK